MTMKRNAFLATLLQAIVAEYGHEEVLDALTRLSHTGDHGNVASQPKQQLSPMLSRQGKTVKPKRPTAVDQVNKASSVTRERDEILTLANRFDRKDFLPSVGDIREFLAMTGSIVEGLTSRNEGFRHLLPVLVKLPPERLKRLANSNSHSGPAQLGPLADAIRSAGETIRRGDRKLTTDAAAIPDDYLAEQPGPLSAEMRDATQAPSKPYSIDEKSSNEVVSNSSEQATDRFITEQNTTPGKKSENGSR
ncbi:hypothetical protein [Reyranella sp.]|uniref:hypothetical protein n=1 Tax=Reyranella sp. TaxID=1929291 RepID=UPI003D0EC5CB